MPFLDDIQNKITAALGILLISWGGYVTAKVVDMPEKPDLQQMVERAQDSGLYVQERSAIQKSISDLHTMVNKLSIEHDRLRDGLGINNDKIIVISQNIWNELSSIKIEVEKMKLRMDYNDDKKKRMKRAPPKKRSPSSDEMEPDEWAPF